MRDPRMLGCTISELPLRVPDSTDHQRFTLATDIKGYFCEWPVLRRYG
jgi:hypothetical protein